ncbi:MAG: helix-turn-helix domain-containing protein [Butyricicoccus sp.]
MNELEIESTEFSNTHFVDENYHHKHAQLIHRHTDELELLYVIHGSGHYVVDAKEYILTPGSLVICNAGIMHGETSDAKDIGMISYCCVLRNVQLKGYPLNTLTKLGQSPVLYITPERRSTFEHIILSLHELNALGTSYRTTCNSLTKALLELVCRMLQQQILPEQNDRITQMDELVQMITAYLDQHFMESVTLEQLGQLFHMSRFHLAHIFKKETGLSPMKYIQQRKIGEAQSLLMNTSQPIAQIGDYLGFYDASHFSATFKKYVGLTPLQYRMNFQENEADGS